MEKRYLKYRWIKESMLPASALYGGASSIWFRAGSPRHKIWMKELDGSIEMKGALLSGCGENKKALLSLLYLSLSVSSSFLSHILLIFESLSLSVHISISPVIIISVSLLVFSPPYSSVSHYISLQSSIFFSLSSLWLILHCSLSVFQSFIISLKSAIFFS